MAGKKACSAMVCGEGTWGAFHQHGCRKPVTVERDGKPYCATHDPIAVAEKRKQRNAKWDEENRQRAEKWERESRIASAVRGLTTEQIEQAITEWRQRHAD